MLPLDTRVRVARKLGTQAGDACLAKAESKDPDFGEKAFRFIVGHIREHGPVPGESATLAAVQAGIEPDDHRAFGAVYARALREKLIQVVGDVPRVRGHGSAGGKLYAAGEGLS
ncbi:MAG: hypothetical protein J7556_14965 [Acidovorax sp.]|nr:hypothetical protein [Acidovorax sp.]